MKYSTFTWYMRRKFSAKNADATSQNQQLTPNEKQSLAISTSTTENNEVSVSKKESAFENENRQGLGMKTSAVQHSAIPNKNLMEVEE